MCNIPQFRKNFPTISIKRSLDYSRLGGRAYYLGMTGNLFCWKFLTKQNIYSNNLSDTLTEKKSLVPSRTYFYNLMTGRRGKIPSHSVPFEKKATNLQQSGSYENYKEIIMKRDLNYHDLIKDFQSSVCFPAEGSAQPATTHQGSNRRLHWDR